MIAKPDTHWTHARLKEYVRSQKLNKVQVPLSGTKATMVKNLKSAGHWSKELPTTNRRTKAKTHVMPDGSRMKDKDMPKKPRAKRGRKNMAKGGPKSLRHDNSNPNYT